MITLQDVVLTAQDGNIGRLKVGLLLAQLTKDAILAGYITSTGEITAAGERWLATQ
jgi:hypothetical protein